jgi:hypothetical protein
LKSQACTKISSQQFNRKQTKLLSDNFVSITITTIIVTELNQQKKRTKDVLKWGYQKGQYRLSERGKGKENEL